MWFRATFGRLARRDCGAALAHARWSSSSRSLGPAALAATAAAAAGGVLCEGTRSTHVSAPAAVDYEDWLRRRGALERRAKGGHSGPRRRMVVYVTGFGPFGSVVENPTTALCRWLDERRGQLEADGIELVGPDVVEVSAVAAREKSAEIAAALGDRLGFTCVLHLGVAQGRRRLSLECRAVNTADFRIPDVRGFVAQGEPVVERAAPGCSEYSTLPLPELLGAMHDARVHAEISTDAGRYICNYIYFRSLHEAAPLGIPVLFMHVPDFRDLSEADQRQGVEALLYALRDLVDRGRV